MDKGFAGTGWRLVASLACLLAVGAVQSAGAEGSAPKLKPSPPQPISASGGFEFASKPKKTRLSVSGVACAKGDVCLVAFDEGVETRVATLTPGAYVAEKTPVPLTDQSGEVDAEGVATDGRSFFVVGSHSRKRDPAKCETPNPLSRTLVRLPVGGDGRPVAGMPKPVDLAATFQRFDALKAADKKCLTDGAGLNIEGVAFSAGRLWFGFRGPTDGANAYILSVDAEAIFAGADATPELRKASVGDGRAIRDMQAVDGGLLLLVGPDDVETNEGLPYGLFYWKLADRSSKEVAVLDLGDLEQRTLDGCDDKTASKVKPEALRVSEQAGAPWKVAILSDGLCDGGPLWFDVERP